MKAATMLVTKDSLNDMLLQADPAKRADIIGRALVAIFSRQTQSEQASNGTSIDNGIGFAGCDALSGSLTAKSYIKNQALLDWQVERWMRPSRGYPRVCKYAKQLNQIAVEKQRTKLEQLRYQYGDVLDSDDPALINPIVAQIKAVEQRLGI